MILLKPILRKRRASTLFPSTFDLSRVNNVPLQFNVSSFSVLSLGIIYVIRSNYVESVTRVGVACGTRGFPPNGA